MAELAGDMLKPTQTDRVADQVAQAAWPYPSSQLSQLWNRPQQQQGDAGIVQLPTLHLGDDVVDPDGIKSIRTNVSDNYAVNSDIAQLYIKNRPAIVRINTMDPKDDYGFNTSAGSGSIIDSSGIIATAYHVVKDATALRVKTADGTIYDARLLAADAAKDEALVQIKSNNPFTQFPTVKLAADSSQAVPHEKLVGLGFPKNEPAMHVSLLTADNRLLLSNLKVTGGLLLGEDKDRALIKTDGPVDNGNSGGPVFDRSSGLQVGLVNLNDQKNGNAYITPIEDLQLFLARTKAKYGIASLPVRIPNTVDQSSFQPPSFQTQFTPGSGLQNLDRILNATGR